MGHTLNQIVALWSRPEELVEIRIALVARDRKTRHRDVAIVQFCQQHVVIRVILDLIIMALHRRPVIGLVLRGACRQRVVAQMCPCRRFNRRL
jgi:hypothetical protein